MYIIKINANILYTFSRFTDIYSTVRHDYWGADVFYLLRNVLVFINEQVSYFPQFVHMVFNYVCVCARVRACVSAGEIKVCLLSSVCDTSSFEELLRKVR